MELIYRAVTIYIVIMILFKPAGRRTLGEMTPFDLVLVLILSEAVQAALVGKDTSLTAALTVLSTFILTEYLLTWLKQRYPVLVRYIEGLPIVLVKKGQIQEGLLKGARVDMDDILRAARLQHGIAQIEEIESAVLETNGQISVIPRDRL